MKTRAVIELAPVSELAVKNDTYDSANAFKRYQIFPRMSSITPVLLHKRTRRGGRRRNRRALAEVKMALETTAPQAWPPLRQRASACESAYVSDDEGSVCSAISAISDLSSAASVAATPTRSRSSSFSSVSSSSTTTSCWWHTTASTDDYDDNISCRTAFQWSALGINLAYAVRTPVISEVDDETDGLFADVVPNLLALVDDSAEAPPAAIKAAPVAVKLAPVAAVVTDDDASEDDASEDEEVKARAVRRARHDKRRVRNLRKLELRAARAARNAAAAVDFDAALNEFTA